MNELLIQTEVSQSVFSSNFNLKSFLIESVSLSLLPDDQFSLQRSQGIDFYGELTVAWYSLRCECDDALILIEPSLIFDFYVASCGLP